jgi:hypothetical protein
MGGWAEGDSVARRPDHLWPDRYDANAFGADIVPGARLNTLHAPVILGRPALICFRTEPGRA